MQYIKVNTIGEFDDIQNRIHQNRLLNVTNYRADKWADPIIGKDGTIICPIEESDFSVLKENDMPAEINSSDDNYFKKSIDK